MWMRIFAAFALGLAVAMPAQAATMWLSVTGRINYDEGTTQAYQPATGTGGPVEVAEGPFGGTELTLVYEYDPVLLEIDSGFDDGYVLYALIEHYGDAGIALRHAVVPGGSWEPVSGGPVAFTARVDGLRDAGGESSVSLSLGAAPGRTEPEVLDGREVLHHRSIATSFDLFDDDLDMPMDYSAPFVYRPADGATSAGALTVTDRIYDPDMETVLARRDYFADFRVDRIAVTREDPVAPVPLPAAGLLLAGALGGLLVLRRR